MLDKYSSKVTSKGQITIPINIRNNLNILTGSKVEMIKKDNCIIVVPINNTLSKLKNSLPKPNKVLSVEEMNNIIKSLKFIMVVVVVKMNIINTNNTDSLLLKICIVHQPTMIGLQVILDNIGKTNI